MSSYISRAPRRDQAQYLHPAPPKRVMTSAGQRLTTILEGDGASQIQHAQGPGAPSRLHNAPFAKRFNHGDPPPANDENSPPSYKTDPSEPDGSQRRRSQSEPSRLTLWFLSRGGWRRLALLTALAIIVAVALGVGLGVGLTRKKSNASFVAPEAGGGSPSSPPPQPFPLGSWNIPVALTTTSTDCSSNPAIWACFPYQTYSQSQTGSLYTFNWVISSTSAHPSDTSLQIASSPDPFGLSYPQTQLSLFDAGSQSERYTFSLPVPKQGTPTPSLVQGGGKEICFFNQSELSATLYTHAQQPASPPTNGQTWPGTVYVEQSSPGGQNIPECFPVDASNNVIGPMITQGLVPQPATARCSCIWDTTNGTSTGAG